MTYWIKSYTKDLDDPQVARLPDAAWRKLQEFRLIAGRLEKDGSIPDVDGLAWMLRQDPAPIRDALHILEAAGLVVEMPGGWFIPTFAEDQAPVPDRQRQAESRKRRKPAEEAPVTKRDTERHANVTELSLKERKKESDTEQRTEQSREREKDSAHAPQYEDPDDWSPVEAMTVPEIKTFMEATGRLPGRPTYRTVRDIIKEHGFTPAQLKPFWEAWNLRGFKPQNLAWLTEWAVAGTIPADQHARPALPAAPARTNPFAQMGGTNGNAQ